MSTSDKATPLMKELAISILKDDLVAARALADLIKEELDSIPILPIKKIECSVENIRVVLYFREDINPEDLDNEQTKQVIGRWLRGEEGHLGLFGVERVELYEVLNQSSATKNPNQDVQSLLKSVEALTRTF